MMTKLLIKVGLSLGTSTALLIGGMFATPTNSRASTVSRSQFNKDITKVQKARSQGGTHVKSAISVKYINYLKAHPLTAYHSGFGKVSTAFATEFAKNTSSLSLFIRDYTGINTIYDEFNWRFPRSTQTDLIQKLTDIDQMDNDLENLPDKADAGRTFSSRITKALNAYGKTVTKVEGVAKITSSSRISSLSAKMTGSMKYLRIVGKATLKKKANYAHIKTYKGYTWAKLNSAGKFSKTVYAPNANTVRVTVGYYANHHFTKVTPYKTAFLN